MNSVHRRRGSDRAGVNARGAVPAAKALVLIATLMSVGCADLLPRPVPPPAIYLLNLPRGPVAASSPLPDAAARPVLIVNLPHAAPGYDSAHMIYQRQPHRLERYAQSEWADTPARMLAPMIVAALQRSQAWRAVLPSPGSGSGDLRLDTEILGLHQDFSVKPSRVQLHLRAVLVDTATRKVVAWREFDHSAVAPTENAEGGVLAANRATEAALQALAAFCDTTGNSWTPKAVAPLR